MNALDAAAVHADEVRMWSCPTIMNLVTPDSIADVDSLHESCANEIENVSEQGRAISEPTVGTARKVGL